MKTEISRGQRRLKKKLTPLGVYTKTHRTDKQTARRRCETNCGN